MEFSFIAARRQISSTIIGLGILAGRRFSGGRLCRRYIDRCRSGEDPLSTQLVDVVVEMPRRFESELGFRMDRAS